MTTDTNNENNVTSVLFGLAAMGVYGKGLYELVATDGVPFTYAATAPFSALLSGVSTILGGGTIYFGL